MLHLRLTSRTPRPDADTDPIGRTYFGWDPDETALRNWQNNRGDWHLGVAATRERYVLFSHEGYVVMAAAITGLEDSPNRAGKKMLVGEPLSSGPVYEQHVKHETPDAVPQSHNPVSYFASSDVATWACECGCGAQIRVGNFEVGHEHIALHQRVSQIGTVSEFIKWFDEVRRTSPTSGG